MELWEIEFSTFWLKTSELWTERHKSFYITNFPVCFPIFGLNQCCNGNSEPVCVPTPRASARAWNWYNNECGVGCTNLPIQNGSVLTRHGRNCVHEHRTNTTRSGQWWRARRIWRWVRCVCPHHVDSKASYPQCITLMYTMYTHTTQLKPTAQFHFVFMPSHSIRESHLRTHNIRQPN